MENSILTSTKKLLLIPDDYTAFDLDIITHINAAFSSLNQLGVGPTDAFSIEDSTAVWDDLALPQNQLSLVKTYVHLKTKMFFDPPATSFLIEATTKLLDECEWRLSAFREATIAPVPPVSDVVYIDVFTGLEVQQ